MSPDSKPREAGWRTTFADVVGDDVSLPGDDTG